MLNLSSTPGVTTIAGFDEEFDEFFKQAVEVVCQYDRANAALLQRRLSVGYARAARIIDQLQEAGVLSPPEGSMPRKVLIHKPEEVLGKAGDTKNTTSQASDDPYEGPISYDTPPPLLLTKIDNVLWEPQLTDVLKSADFKATNLTYPLPVGLDENNTLRVESMLDVGNLIIAGNPLSKKENLVDTILVSLLLRYANGHIPFILNDPTCFLTLNWGSPAKFVKEAA